MRVKIEFDKGQGPYRGGELITGKVVLKDNSREKEVEAFPNEDLIITFQGIAWAHLKEIGVSQDYLQIMQHQPITEEYLNESLKLSVSSPNNSQSWTSNTTLHQTIFQSTMELPFSFQLPHNLPSSFHSKHGGVIYSAHVNVPSSTKDSQSGSTEHVNFIVQGSHNLNSSLINKQPGYLIRSEIPWLGFGFGIKAILWTDKRGYSPGEELNFKLEVENETRLHLQKIRINLIQITTYLIRDVTRRKIEKCEEYKCPDLKSWQTLHHLGKIIIPTNLPPTKLGGCKIVQPHYYLELCIKTGALCDICLYFVLKDVLPISIGTLDETKLFPYHLLPIRKPPLPSSSGSTKIETCPTEGKGVNNNAGIVTISHVNQGYPVVLEAFHENEIPGSPKLPSNVFDADEVTNSFGSEDSSLDTNHNSNHFNIV